MSPRHQRSISIMLIRRSATLFLILLLLCTNLFSQTGDAQAEKEKKAKELEEQIVTLLDRTIAEAAGLRLAQNRAVINALIGDLYWRYDPDRSRELFRSAAGEIITYQTDAERERLENIGFGIPEMFDGSDPRLELLNLVGTRDAELALQLMSQTRTAALAAAMATVAQQQEMGLPPGTGGPGGGQGASPGANAANAMENARAQQEINLEQSLIMRAAMNDPEKTVKAIKDSLAKGVSTNVVTLLQQLMQKDEKLAAELASDVISKLTSTDLSRSSNDLNGAIGILQFMTRPLTQQNPNNKAKVFAFTESQARDAALKVANTLLMASPPAFVTGALGRAIPLIEKLAPEKGVLLRAKDAANKRPATANGNARPGQGGQNQRRLWNPGDTPENIIAAAAKITNVREKNSALQAAAGRIGQITDEARAKKIIDSIPDEKIRAQAQNQFDANRINRMTVEGRLDEAKASVGALTSRRSQIQRLVALATQYQKKNTEKDRETAASLMIEAKTLGPAYPEDEDELADYMEVIRGYAVVEPDVAFRMIEPLMVQFDEYIQSSAVLSRFNKRDRNFKKGEMVMRINGGANLLPFRYLPQIQLLAKADLDRMSLLADRFQRNDARTLMKLYVLQGYQRSQAPPSPARNE